MKDRIKAIRKSLKLSQTEFGKQIGVTIGVIRNLEDGVTQLRSPQFELFCKVYNVNPDWLLSGIGEMFLPHNDNTLSSLQKEYNLSDNAMKLIHNFIQMNAAQQDELLHTLNQLIGG